MAVNYFRIKVSDIREKRWDPPYHKSQDHTYFDNYTKTLQDYIISIVNGTDSRQYVQEGIPYLKVTNIKTTGLSRHNLQFLPYDTPYKNKLQKGDLLVTRKGTFGVATIVTDEMEDMLISSEIFHIRLNGNINPYILAYYINTDVIQKELIRQSIGAIMGSLTQEVLLSLPIPDEFDHKIADIMDHAYAEKQRLESEAKELLNSIDSYVMNELGIKQIEQSKATNKWFTVKASDIRGNRWDAPYYISQGKVSTGKYPIITLDECSINQGSYGANETAIDIKENSYTRYIRITDIDIYGQLKLKGQKTANNINERYILQTDDFLFARTGSVGRTFLYKEKYGKSIFAGYLIKFILNKDKIYPEYLFYYTQTSHYWAWVNKHQRPAVQSNINADEYRSLQIPLPPIEIQKEIALECETRRNTAQQNQQLAQDILAKAKANVEKILFEL